ncbi:expressed unknown protein [Seminavis robusta]|uniref:Uncharacterized protein n=1 Tax=Seminavis robusta TaxID=568900 RepID=A0A9N8DQG8_9STRA|nr:expressed unknown protein [Seminavis robusta]|eukprot:Sro282_g107380.1 n/a (182) ;mRNA; f:4972-5517
MRFRCLFFKSVVLLAASHVSLADKGDPIPCSVASDCHALLQSSSACVDGFCTNPFRGGCLKQLKEGWNKTRACHSEDTEENLQHCTIPEFEDDYMEIRISALNWQSAYFNAWILQILLSELVGVPSTIETGNAAGNMDFYDATRPMELGDAHDWEGLRRAQEVGDCRVLNHLEMTISPALM